MFDQNEVRNIFDICGSVMISSLGCYDDLVIVLEYNSCIMHLKIVAVEKTNRQTVPLLLILIHASSWYR